MERTLAIDATQKIGGKITLEGWVFNRRDHGKLIFIDLFDRTVVIQLVCGEDASDLNVQDVITVEGEVKERGEKNINPKLPTGKVEVKVSKINVLSHAQELPFDITKENLEVELPTLLDYRPLTLRHPKVKAIFKKSSRLLRLFGLNLRRQRAIFPNT